MALKAYYSDAGEAHFETRMGSGLKNSRQKYVFLFEIREAIAKVLLRQEVVSRVFENQLILLNNRLYAHLQHNAIKMFWLLFHQFSSKFKNRNLVCDDVVAK